MTIPIITVQIEGIREQIRHAFVADGDNLNRMIGEGLEKALSERSIQGEINVLCHKLLDEVLDDLSSNYRVKQAVTDMIADSLEAR